MVITSTGYYNTGSSAVCDLLKEYRSCSEGVYAGAGCEHIILYTPNGLFDLEDKLLIGNSIHRSDEALDTFKTAMLKLYKNNFIWFGNFKQYFGEKFLRELDHFVDELVDYKTKTTWYYDYLDTKFSIARVIKNTIRKPLHINYSGDFSQKLVIREKGGIKYSFVTAEKFYSAAKQFINTYISFSTTDNDKTLILDHFLLPHNLYRLPNYFDDNIRIFVVERDPRDVYIQQMNQRHQRSESIPMQIDEYISFWRDLRRIEKPIEDNRICRINFEDLIYDYDETVSKIERFCGLNSADHIDPKKYFTPEKSIKNTKLYVGNTEYRTEIEKIERELPEYLYLK